MWNAATGSGSSDSASRYRSFMARDYSHSGYIVNGYREQRSRGQGSEAGGRRSESGGRRAEVRGRRSEDGGQRTEARGRREEGGGQRTEGRGRGRDDRAHRTPPDRPTAAA